MLFESMYNCTAIMIYESVSECTCITSCDVQISLEQHIESYLLLSYVSMQIRKAVTDIVTCNHMMPNSNIECVFDICSFLAQCVVFQSRPYLKSHRLSDRLEVLNVWPLDSSREVNTVFKSRPDECMSGCFYRPETNGLILTSEHCAIYYRA